jgi:hypothetical protein
MDRTLLWIGTITAVAGGLAALIGLIIGSQPHLWALNAPPFLVLGCSFWGPCRRGSPLRSEAPCLRSDWQISGHPCQTKNASPGELAQSLTSEEHNGSNDASLGVDGDTMRAAPLPPLRRRPGPCGYNH